MINLKGKTALITGGTRGIGAATSRMLVKAGAIVAVAYRSNEKAADTILAELNLYGQHAVAVRGDLSDQESAESVVAEALDHLEHIDILVNNHGIWNEMPLEALDVAILDELIAVNLRSVFLVTAPVVKHMKQRGTGTIINVSSTAGQRGEAFHSHYAASKGAIISMTKSWSSEFAPSGITCNCVAPGWVETEMCDGVFSNRDFREYVRESIPVKRIATPEDIAGPILFLASPLARHISGEIINVNGGAVLPG
jgi:3-oxoacyl-[acyl-carrier protein] reductase